MDVNFKFIIDQKVKTNLGTIGVITMLGVDESGNLYSVKTVDSCMWYKEKHIEAVME